MEVMAIVEPNTNANVHAVYTIGYKGLSIPLFIEKLQKAGIKRLIDVRYNAISRKPGFSKKRLSTMCEQFSIEYIHLPELGIPSSYRKSLRTTDEFNILMDEYEASMVPKAADTLQKATQLVQELPSALLCFEADHNRCHRSPLARCIASNTGLSVIHL